MENDIQAEIRKILNESRPDDRAHQTIDPSRKHFAHGLFLIGIFLAAFAGVMPESERFFWGCNAGFVVVIAAWLWDKSRTTDRQ